MILWTFQWITLSLLLIILVHYLYTYLKNALTIQIVEDYGVKNKKRYDDMLAPIHSDTETISITSDNVENNDTNINVMKHELQAFLNELKTNDDT